MTPLLCNSTTSTTSYTLYTAPNISCHLPSQVRLAQAPYKLGRELPPNLVPLSLAAVSNSTGNEGCHWLGDLGQISLIGCSFFFPSRPTWSLESSETERHAGDESFRPSFVWALVASHLFQTFAMTCPLLALQYICLPTD